MRKRQGAEPSDRSDRIDWLGMTAVPFGRCDNVSYRRMAARHERVHGKENGA
jgi:hypothetical protein